MYCITPLPAIEPHDCQGLHTHKVGDLFGANLTPVRKLLIFFLKKYDPRLFLHTQLSLLLIQLYRIMTSLNFRVYSHNVRYATLYPGPNEEPWKNRRELVASSIKTHCRYHTVVCLQEVLHSQLTDLLDLLGTNWTYFGVGRNDGKEAGEYAPVFYDKTQWQLIEGSTQWLSETPQRPSVGWDAAQERILTFVHFRDLASGRVLGVFNTHFDDQGSNARKQSAKFVCRNVHQNAQIMPIVFAGDLNSLETDESYKILSGELVDTFYAIDKTSRYGFSTTYTGFKNSDHHTRIDYIFTPNQQHAVHVGVLPSQLSHHTIRFSDHRPIFTDFSIMN